MKKINIKSLFVSLVIIASLFMSGTANSIGEKPDGHSTYYGEIKDTLYEFTINRCAPCTSSIRNALGWCRCAETTGRKAIVN